MKYDRLLILIRRQQQGMTQHDCAAAAGMSIRQWQKYESGESEPLIGAYIKIIDALGIDFTDLLR